MKIGIDIIEIERLKQKLENNPRLEGRLFTVRERKYCRSFLEPYSHFAGTLAAKEAVIKCLERNPGWKKIEVFREDGVPFVFLEGKELRGTLSISHTEHTAVAVFLLLE